jgi:hypothetical protein
MQMHINRGTVAQNTAQTASAPCVAGSEGTAGRNMLMKAFLLALAVSMFSFAAAGLGRSSRANPQGALQGADHYQRGAASLVSK